MSHRYTLTRTLLGLAGMGRVLFVMLNPSTADDAKDDATIRRCKGFAKAWGYESLEVVNLFALRATNPAGLLNVDRHLAIGGIENNAAIMDAARRANLIVCAWGAHARLGPLLHERAQAVVQMLRSDGHALHVLGFALNGQPLHPLRQPRTFRPRTWDPTPAKRSSCAYCAGSGEAWDRQTGEGPVCPGCGGSGRV